MSSDGSQRQTNEISITPAQLEEGLARTDDRQDSQHPQPYTGEHSSLPNDHHSTADSSLHPEQQGGYVQRPKDKHRVRFGFGNEAFQEASGSDLNCGEQSRSGDGSPSGNSEMIVGGSAATSTRSAMRSQILKPLNISQSGPSSSSLDGSVDITDSPIPFFSSRDKSFRAANLRGDDLESVNIYPHAVKDPAEVQADRARDRAERLSRSLEPERLSRSAPGSKLPSPISSGAASPTTTNAYSPAIPRDITTLIPMEKLQQRRKKYGIEDDTDSEEENEANRLQTNSTGLRRITNTARRLMNKYGGGLKMLRDVKPVGHGLASGQVTPVYEQGDPEYYVPPPGTYRGGILSALLHIDRGSPSVPLPGSRTQSLLTDSRTLTANGTPLTTPGGSPTNSTPSSGHATPRRKPPRWHEKKRSTGGNSSKTSLAGLINSSNMLAGPGAALGASTSRPPLKSYKRSSGAIDTLKSLGKKEKRGKEYYIQYHIEDVLARQQYIINCCRALMKYGAPTHRLEEYLRYLSRCLQIKAQFLYIPGCMLVSFDDPTTHTTETLKVVRETQGVDLGKLRDLHDIYKAVTHDKMGVKEASEMLNDLWNKKPRYPPWVCVLLYGCASATVGPFAFNARPIDMPIAFFLGCLLGFMQLILAPKSELYSNVFEITAAVVTSFLARAFGSIRGGSLFCFSALAQSSIALILPGYMVLGAALELQSRNMVAGSVRMVYSVLYSLFLGFGITIGTAFYGGIDANATTDTECRTQPIHSYLKFIFVPFFTLCLVFINQAKWRQAPVMVVISFAGYVVNYFSALRFASNAQVANSLGALAIGVIGNLYSRLGQGVSAAALLPAIFVQVPSGLAASGSLISGINTAEQIVSNSTVPTSSPGNPTDGGIVFNVGYSMIQVAVGLTVGLFFSSLLIYPLGKKRSGLFSF